jgi:uncharacterized protein YjbI with pentapeptide repeats
MSDRRRVRSPWRANRAVATPPEPPPVAPPPSGKAPEEEPGFWKRTIRSLTLPVLISTVGGTIAVVTASAGLYQLVTSGRERCEALRNTLRDPTVELSAITPVLRDSVVECATRQRATALLEAVTAKLRDKAPYVTGSPCSSPKVDKPNAQSAADANVQRAIDLAVALAQKAGDSIDLRYTDLHDAEFNRDTLRRANFTGACLAGAQFHGTSVEGAAFLGARLDAASFNGAHLDGAVFDSAVGKWTELTESTLTDASFGGARLIRARFNESDLACTRFTGEAVLDTADFSSTNLQWSYLRGASLVGVRNWRDMDPTGLTGTLLFEHRGLTTDLLDVARKGGAYVDTQPDEWIAKRDSACARRNRD